MIDMNDTKDINERISLIKEAILDYEKGILTQYSLLSIIATIIYPKKPTKEDIDWAMDELVEKVLDVTE